MTRWHAWFKDSRKESFSVLLLAMDIDCAEMLGYDYALRSGTQLIGIGPVPVEGEKER